MSSSRRLVTKSSTSHGVLSWVSENWTLFKGSFHYFIEISEMMWPGTTLNISSSKSHFLEKDLGFFYGAKLDIMGIGDNDRSKTKTMGKRKSKETGVVEEVLDNIVEVDENKGRKKDLEQEAV